MEVPSLEKSPAQGFLSQSRDFSPIWLFSDSLNLSIKRVNACDCPGHAEQIHGFLRLSNFGFDCGTFGSPTLRLFRLRYPLRDRLTQIAKAKEGREYRQEEACHRPARGPPTPPTVTPSNPTGFRLRAGHSDPPCEQQIGLAVDQDYRDAAHLAVLAAPFRHSKLTATKILGDPNNPVHFRDDATADELRAEIMKRIAMLQDAGLIDLQALPAPKRKIAN